MSAILKVIPLTNLASRTALDIAVGLPDTGSGWKAVSMVPYADPKVGPCVVVGFDNQGTGGQVIFAKGITGEDTSTGVTAGTSETPYTNVVTIPSTVGLLAGDRIRVSAKVKQLTQNGADTIALALAMAANAAGLAASTCILSTVAAVSAAANVTWQLQFEGRVAVAGAAATATILGSGTSWKNGATPAFLGTDLDDNTTVSTLADICVGVTYTYSASSAGNTSRIKELFVEVIRPNP